MRPAQKARDDAPPRTPQPSHARRALITQNSLVGVCALYDGDASANCGLVTQTPDVLNADIVGIKAAWSDMQHTVYLNSPDFYAASVSFV